MARNLHCVSSHHPSRYPGLRHRHKAKAAGNSYSPSLRQPRQCSTLLVVLVDAHPRQPWLRRAVERRLREAWATRHVEVNEEKSRRVDRQQGESFGVLGFAFRRIRRRSGRWMPLRMPRLKAHTAILRQRKPIVRRHRSGPLKGFIEEINPILRRWVQYFTVGHLSRCFSYVRRWVEQQVRRHLATARKRPGFGWQRWSSPTTSLACNWLNIREIFCFPEPVFSQFQRHKYL